MRELCAGELPLVGGAGLNFNTPITMSVLNDVAAASTIGRAVMGSFAAGYAIGTWLNNTFDLSTKIVDALE